jgi:hypothetical protein
MRDNLYVEVPSSSTTQGHLMTGLQKRRRSDLARAFCCSAVTVFAGSALILEDFADFYHSGKHRQDDPFALMEKHEMERKGIKLCHAGGDKPFVQTMPATACRCGTDPRYPKPSASARRFDEAGRRFSAVGGSQVGVEIAKMKLLLFLALLLSLDACQSPSRFRSSAQPVGPVNTEAARVGGSTSTT